MNMYNDSTCSFASIEIGEQLFATAPTDRIWFLLEYPLPWGHKALEESDLPTRIKAHLSALLKAILASRLQFIKNHSSSYPREITFFIAALDETNPLLFEIRLAAYRDLLSLDIPAILSGEQPGHVLLRTDPIYLVCTNGKRDPCCSRYGLPIYKKLTTLVGETAWETTHIGGHRFAANLVCFPHGIVYGRVAEEDVEVIHENYRHHRIYLGKYRGRAGYGEVVQAGEFFLRQRSGLADLSIYKLISQKENLPENWTVTFAETAGKRIHELQVGLDKSDLLTIKSCRDDKSSPVNWYQLVKHQVL